MNQKGKNYYEILEIPYDATPDEVYQGYLRAKNAYSQDSLALYSLMSEDECQNILGLIDEAYSIISDPSKRQQYDSVRGISSSQASSSRASLPQPESNLTQNLNKNQESTEKNITKTVARLCKSK